MNRFKYTPVHLAFLKTGFMSMNVRDLTAAFNKRFKVQKSTTAIHAALTNNKITCGRKHKDRLITRKRLFTEQQEQFIRNEYKNISVKELTARFNSRFEKHIPWQQIKSFTGRYKITSGRTGQFPKGNKPWNKDTKGLTSANKTSFKKGQVPPNIQPLGHERICPKDGFILIKIAEKNPHTGFPTRYKHKQVHIWEKENGPVPEGKVVAFKDSDKTNCEPKNLMLISRAQLLDLNRLKYKDTPAELKPSVLALSKLRVKTRAMEKR
jgi:hypothetical protein